MPANMDPFDTGNPEFGSPEMTEARAEANDAIEVGPAGAPVVADAFGGGDIPGDPVASFEEFGGPAGDFGALEGALGGDPAGAPIAPEIDVVDAAVGSALDAGTDQGGAPSADPGAAADPGAGAETFVDPATDPDAQDDPQDDGGAGVA